MLLCRNYKIKKKKLQQLQKDASTFNNSKQFCITLKKCVGEHQYKKVFVCFSTDKFGIKLLRQKIVEITNDRIDHVIFVLNNKFTSHARRLIETHSTIQHELFFWNEMLICPIEHELVPKHQLLSPEEKIQFEKVFGTKIPGIKVSDRICRYYFGEVGDMFRIHRKQGIYYRIVVP